MINKVTRIVFAILGAITGFTVTRAFLMLRELKFSAQFTILAYIAVSLIFAVLFYLLSTKIMGYLIEALNKLDNALKRMTLFEIGIGAAGLIVGLIVANLLIIPINRLEVIGVPISIVVNILFACIGIGIAIDKRGDLSDSLSGRKGSRNIKHILLDTSVIIDGRVAGIRKAGFIDGDMIVPSFVLEELRRISDSQDSTKRNRGKQGLEVLNILQKELQCPIRIENLDNIEGAEVDDKLLKAAAKLGACIITTDYNLNRVAKLHNICVLNINELANAVKPIAIPGEEIVVQVVKDGKENGQGIAYLDDGTMIVVEGGRRHIGETIHVMVTSVLQTAAGRMIFAKPIGA